MFEGRAVVVVVPAFEEENHIGGVLATMPSFVDRIVVVDDGSGDRTSEVARSSAAAPLSVVGRHEARRGVGAAIATGYTHSVGLTRADEDAIAVMAGDGQMDPDDLAAVVRPITSGRADYVKGQRFD